MTPTLYINTFNPGATGSFTSDVVAAVAQNSRYELTTSLGRGLDVQPSLYTIELLANSSVIATCTLDGMTTSPGTFTTLTTTYVSPAAGAILGQQLQIRLTGTNVTGAAQQIQAHFDNVRLDVTAVPEPGAFALTGFIGLLLAVASISRRRLCPIIT